jgi:hypothetical protein
MTRIVRIKGHTNSKVIIGADFDNILKDGHVYSIRDLGGELILTDLGEHETMENHEFESLDVIMYDGSFINPKM